MFQNSLIFPSNINRLYSLEYRNMQKMLNLNINSRITVNGTINDNATVNDKKKINIRCF